jgi:hypothetical protein
MKNHHRIHNDSNNPLSVRYASYMTHYVADAYYP